MRIKMPLSGKVPGGGVLGFEGEKKHFGFTLTLAAECQYSAAKETGKQERGKKSRAHPNGRMELRLFECAFN